MNQQAIELLRAVSKDADLYDGKVGASTRYNVNTFLKSLLATNGISNDEVLRECREQAAKGKAADAVKRFRSLTGCSLPDAHYAVTRA